MHSNLSWNWQAHIARCLRPIVFLIVCSTIGAVSAQNFQTPEEILASIKSRLNTHFPLPAPINGTEKLLMSLDGTPGVVKIVDGALQVFVPNESTYQLDPITVVGELPESARVIDLKVFHGFGYQYSAVATVEISGMIMLFGCYLDMEVPEQLRLKLRNLRISVPTQKGIQAIEIVRGAWTDYFVIIESSGLVSGYFVNNYHGAIPIIKDVPKESIFSTFQFQVAAVAQYGFAVINEEKLDVSTYVVREKGSGLVQFSIDRPTSLKGTLADSGSGLLVLYENSVLEIAINPEKVVSTQKIAAPANTQKILAFDRVSRSLLHIGTDGKRYFTSSNGSTVELGVYNNEPCQMLVFGNMTIIGSGTSVFRVANGTVQETVLSGSIVLDTMVTEFFPRLLISGQLTSANGHCLATIDENLVTGFNRVSKDDDIARLLQGVPFEPPFRVGSKKSWILTNTALFAGFKNE